MNTQCTGLTNSIGNNASKLQTIDTNLNTLRNSSQAAKIVPLATNIKTRFQSILNTGSAMKLKCAQQTTALPALGRNIDSSVNEIGTLLQQAIKEPSQLETLTARITTAVNTLETNLKSVDQQIDNTATQVNDVRESRALLIKDLAAVHTEVGSIAPACSATTSLQQPKQTVIASILRSDNSRSAPVLIPVQGTPGAIADATGALVNAGCSLATQSATNTVQQQIDNATQSQTTASNLARAILGGLR
jgi:chromosome segregation ATPase